MIFFFRTSDRSSAEEQKIVVEGKKLNGDFRLVSFYGLSSREEGTTIEEEKRGRLHNRDRKRG